MEQNELKILAQNLANPQGEKGIEIGEMMNETNLGMTLESIKALSVEDGNHILEIGHGNGRHVENLLARAENLRYIGIDISETMHIEAEKNNTKFQDKAEFVLYEGEILPFRIKLSTKFLP